MVLITDFLQIYFNFNLRALKMQLTEVICKRLSQYAFTNERKPDIGNNRKSCITNYKTMRPYILAETNWKHIKETPVELAILPWGATEAHNYHLPYGTDIIEADSIAAAAAKIAWEAGAKIMVLPTVPFGVNTGQADITLDINLNPSTQLAILDDIITVLNRQGIFKLLIVNSHGGNDFKILLR